MLRAQANPVIIGETGGSPANLRWRKSLTVRIPFQSGLISRLKTITKIVEPPRK